MSHFTLYQWGGVPSRTAFNYLGSGHRCSPLVCLNDGLGDHSPPGGPTCPVLLVAFDRLFGATLHSPLKKKKILENPGNLIGRGLMCLLWLKTREPGCGQLQWQSQLVYRRLNNCSDRRGMFVLWGSLRRIAGFSRRRHLLFVEIFFVKHCFKSLCKVITELRCFIRQCG